MYYSFCLKIPFEEPVRMAEEFKNLVNCPYDVLVGTGISGTIGLMALRSQLNVDIAIVRKEGDLTHSPYLIEDTRSKEILPRKWIFVDDLIETGVTLRRVIKKFGEEGFLGAFLYAEYDNVKMNFISADKLTKFKSE